MSQVVPIANGPAGRWATLRQRRATLIRLGWTPAEAEHYQRVLRETAGAGLKRRLEEAKN